MEGYQNFVELLKAREINVLRAFCVCAALRPSVRMRFRHVYQHFLQRHYHTSFRLPTPPLQPQPKHEIIPLYVGPQRPANA
jgi:hypothetical protein